MKHILLFISIFLLQINLTAQPPNASGGKANPNKKEIKGVVINEQNIPVPFASVAAYLLPDSTLATGVATSENGAFSIRLNKGTYFLKVSFLSYKAKTTENINLADEDIDLGNVVLMQDNVALEEVVVRDEKSSMQLDLDKRVFNVGKDMANLGTNVSELLDNVPSVNVDIDGNVSLRGSGGVRILIDGKPSGLVGIGGTDGLKQLQSSLVEKVEVITNPSARYDAEGEVGIINIVMKKEKRKGVNGSFEATVGFPHNHRLSGNINFRRKKINFFTNYGINFRESPGSGNTYQEYISEEFSNIYRSEREHIRGGLGNRIQFGADYFLNKFNTITVSGMYRYNKGNNDATVLYEDFDNNNTLLQTVDRINDEVETKHNVETAISYVKTFEQKGRKLTVDAKWMLNDDTEIADYIEESSDNSVLPIIQRSGNTEDELVYFFQSDYVHPFSKKGKFETGVRLNLRYLNNKYKVEEEIDDTWNVYEDLNNHFVYSENIYAAYVMLGNHINAFSYQFGLRAEYSDIGTELLETNEKNPRDYLNWFPSVNFSYELPKQNTLQLSYSRRLNRPRFWSLLPFFTFSDSRNLFTGNPNLNPEYTNSFEAGHLKNFEQGNILSNVYYRHSTGVIERVVLVNDDGTTQMLPINFAEEHSYGIEFNFSYNITKNWRVNANWNGYRSISDGDYEGVNYSNDAYSWVSRISTKIKLPKDFDLQTSLNYRGPSNTTQGRSLAIYGWDAGLAKDVLNGNGTISFSARDILNTRKRRHFVETTDYYSELEFQWRSRQFLLTFNYRLNQKKKRGRGGYGGGGAY
ncbi:MAG: TonB-dependent receptor domain-containing protein [Chitinophagales bacterium]